MRDESGRFVKGSTGNPTGRASKEREVRYYEITMSACTYEDWKAIVQRATKQAKAGDGVARKWLSDFLVGVPVQPVDHTVEIIEVRRSNASD